MPYTKEHAVVSKLSKEVLAFVDRAFGKKRSIKSKSAPGDLVTDIDLAVDRLVRKRLGEAFADPVVTEETPGNMLLDTGRVWVIDPICGTSNLAHDIRFFCTNIALVEDGITKAAWVIDHCTRTLIYGLEGKTVYRENVQQVPIGKLVPYARVYLCQGYWRQVPTLIRHHFAEYAREIFLATGLGAVNYGTSLGFAYIATGQVEATVVINVYPWDLLASCFLVQQNGGRATTFDGSPVTTATKSAVLAANASLHRRLLELLNKHKLSTVR